MSTEDAATLPCGIAKYATGVDHIAIAVEDLEESLHWYTTVLGFSLLERRRTEGANSGMISAVLEAGPLQVVLLQGTSPESQVSKFINYFGPGVQHLAVRVENIEAVTEDLRQAGLEFDTSIIGSGSLRQVFTKRDKGSGLMIELIERSQGGFSEQNVSDLFSQLEKKNTF